MDVIVALRTFVRVAELQGFSAAARDLGVTQPTVSKAVAQLEAHLGARLLQRTTHALSLTEDGREALSLAKRLTEDWETFEASFGARKISPVGLVRVAAPVAFGRMLIVPQLPALLARFPTLEVELVLADEAVDLVDAGLDLAVRIGEIANPDLIARRLGRTRRAVFASADYLARFGRPESVHDLKAHTCILHTRLASGAHWLFQLEGEPVAVPVRGKLRANSADAVREAVLQGIGLALTPTWLLRDAVLEGRVEALLTGCAPPDLPIHAVWPSRRHTPPKVRAFVEHLAQAFAQDPLLASD